MSSSQEHTIRNEINGKWLKIVDIIVRSAVDEMREIRLGFGNESKNENDIAS